MPPSRQFFRSGKRGATYLMEASFDESMFYPAIVGAKSNSMSTSIAQLEVENKYRPIEAGTKFVDRFEKALANAYSGTPVVDSKYLMAVKQLGIRK